MTLAQGDRFATQELSYTQSAELSAEALTLADFRSLGSFFKTHAGIVLICTGMPDFTHSMVVVRLVMDLMHCRFKLFTFPPHACGTVVAKCIGRAPCSRHSLELGHSAAIILIILLE